MRSYARGYTAPPRWALSPSRTVAPELWDSCSFSTCYAWGKNDLVAGVVGTLVTNGASVPARAIGARGMAYDFLTGNTTSQTISSAIDYGTPAFSAWTNYDFSICVFGRYDGKSQINGLVARKESGSTNPGLSLQLNTFNTGDGSVNVQTANSSFSSAAGIVSAGQTFTIIFTRSGASAQLYNNGVQIAQTSAFNTSIGTSTYHFFVGAGSSDATVNFGHNGLIYSAQVWSRTLSGAEVNALSQDPFVMFRQARRIRVISGTPASVDLTAGSLVLAGTAPQPATGQASSAGAGTLSFSGQAPQSAAGQSARLQPATLSFAGQPVQPAAGQANRLQAGVLSLAGQTVQPIAGQAASVSPGALTILGQALTVQIGTNVPAVIDIASGSLSLTPQELLAQAGFAVVAGASSVSLAGKPLAVSAGMVDVLGPATLNIAGQVLQFATGADVSIDIGAGKLDLGGVSFGSVAGLQEAVAAGVITLTGNAITVTSGGVIIIDSARLVVIQGFDRIVRIN